MLRLIPDEAALLIKSAGARVLVVADLHLGFERELALAGIRLPSQTGRVLGRIEELAARYKPTRIVLLGDVKHTTVEIAPQEYREIPDFLKALRALGEVTIVPGNHDGDIMDLVPRGVEVAPARGILVEDGKRRIALLHGHAWPEAQALAADALVFGHTHPTVEFREPSGLRMVEPAWVFARWERRKMAAAYLRFKGIDDGGDPLAAFQGAFGLGVKSPRIVIMPAFNRLLGGMAMNAGEGAMLGPIFSSGAVDMEKAELYLLDGTYLGPLGKLKAARG